MLHWKSKQGLLVCLVLCCLILSGCSWTGRMLGMGSDKAEEKKAEQTAAPAGTEPAAGQEPSQAQAAAPKPPSPVEKELAPSPVPVAPPSNQPLEKAVPLPPRTTPPQTTQQASLQPGQPGQPSPADPNKPLTQIGVKGPVLRDNGDLDYFNVANIQAAIKAAMDKDTFLGYTDPFHAFPVFPGNDTVSGAFVPADKPSHKVFFHSFYLPDRPFHRRIYGYTVIDMRTNADFGHFDGDGDGVFEQRTLEPKIVIDSFQNQPASTTFNAPPITAPKAKPASTSVPPSSPSGAASTPFTRPNTPGGISPKRQ